MEKIIFEPEHLRMEKYQNKYRIASARLQGYNYANAGLYFITICTANREHYFGEIKNGKMQLSKIGKIVQTEWFKTIEIRADMNLQLDAFVVMPNHIHGIIIIGENEYNNGGGGGDCGGGGDGGDGGDGRDAMHRVSTATATATATAIPAAIPTIPTIPTTSTGSTVTISNEYKNSFAPQSKNLASIMRGYKSSVTKQVHILGFDFNWQSRFYDHIIRTAKSLERIQNYIINNPQKWTGDKFNKNNTN